MSDLSLFLKSNKKVKQNSFYPATKSLVDKDGKPLLWEIRPVSTKRNDEIREQFTTEVPVKGKPNMFRQKVDMSGYQAKLLCEAVVFPNLNDKDLQDSYGIMTPEDLLKEMIDEAGEYASFSAYVQKVSGFTPLQEDVDTAKN